MDQSGIKMQNANNHFIEELIKGSEEPLSNFNIIIGYLEEIIISEDFQSIQDKFMNEYYNEFDEIEENKFSYTTIHEKYIDTIERMLEEQLCKRIPNFSMDSFLHSLVSNHECLDGEVFEMLHTFTDFLAFKEMMIDYKKAKTGQTVHLELTNSYDHHHHHCHHHNNSSLMNDQSINEFPCRSSNSSTTLSCSSTIITTTYSNGETNLNHGNNIDHDHDH
ncbi:ADP-ribosylation factor-like protein 2-binding protein [Schistosoma japonicum]|nr:ADP-ribosylation factor-like protein 2-binding protein [Schistosoma japonicum]